MQKTAKVKTTEIVPFGIQELTPANIAVLQKRCDEMVIGPDGEGYEDVKVVHIRAKKIRTAIKDRHKELKSDALKACQELDDKKRKMNGIIEPMITTLAEKRDAWDNKVAAIEAEKKHREQERTQERFDQLNKYQCSMPFFEVAAMTDDEFNVTLENAKTHFEEEQDRKAKEEAERKAESDRLEKVRKEQEAEAEKMRIAKENLEAAAREIAEEKRQIEEEKRLAIAKKEAVEHALKEEKEKRERVEKKRIEREKAEAAEKKNQEALRPDKEKLIKWVEGFTNKHPGPVLKNKRAKHILKKATGDIEIILQEVLEYAEKNKECA